MLKIEDVYVNYGKSRIVNGVTFDVDRGEKLVVLGRNGVGKTTLMKGIMGVCDPAKGKIIVDDVNVTKARPFKHSREGIGYVPQGREILSNLTVYENLKVGVMGHPKIDFKTSFDMVLDYFPALNEHLTRQAGVLSGGQKQQLALARCLMSKPKYVVLDEPTEGIQPNVVSEIASILNRIAKEMNIGIILVEQNLGFARKIAEKYIIIQKGEVVSRGGIEEITDEIARAYLAV